MKTTKYIAWTVGITTLASVAALARPPWGAVYFPPPPVVVAAPPIVVAPAPVVVAPEPTVTVTVGVPDSYVWDGDEYVGVIGSDYYYLGPGNVWIPCDSARVGRFHSWERDHGDWREHAIHNVKYRNDAHGHSAPMRSEDRDNHYGHEGDRDHHDRDRDH